LFKNRGRDGECLHEKRLCITINSPRIDKKFTDIFGAKPACAPVKAEKAAFKGAVKALFETRVDAGGSEGIVVHSKLPIVYKIRPRYTVDAAIMGFSEGDKSAVRSLLYAVMTPAREY
jgi:hypothetical protein